MSELVLSSQKVRSNKLKDYNFKFSNIDKAIKDLSNKNMTFWHKFDVAIKLQLIIKNT